MRLDADYMRQLMIDMEESPDPIRYAQATNIKDKKDVYHLQILCDMGYVAQVNSFAYRLTADGHNFLATTRTESSWKNIKERAANIASELPMYAIKAAIQSKIKELIG